MCYYLQLGGENEKQGENIFHSSEPDKKQHFSCSRRGGGTDEGNITRI